MRLVLNVTVLVSYFTLYLHTHHPRCPCSYFHQLLPLSCRSNVWHQARRCLPRGDNVLVSPTNSSTTRYIIYRLLTRKPNDLATCHTPPSLTVSPPAACLQTTTPAKNSRIRKSCFLQYLVCLSLRLSGSIYLCPMLESVLDWQLSAVSNAVSIRRLYTRLFGSSSAWVYREVQRFEREGC